MDITVKNTRKVGYLGFSRPCDTSLQRSGLGVLGLRFWGLEVLGFRVLGFRFSGFRGFGFRVPGSLIL